MLWCSVSNFDFRALDGGKMCSAATPAPKGLVPKNPTRNVAHIGVLLGHMLSQNHAPEPSDPGTPLKMNGYKKYKC